MTGEYVVLDGARALSLPTKYGQRMTIDNHSEVNLLYWKSWNAKGELWLEGVWNAEKQEWKSITHPSSAKYIEILFRYADQEFGIALGGHIVNTYLEFPNEWGLGSSSTLISLIAQWWRTDPYYLLEKTFGGSGYDIACATATSAIIYQRVGTKSKTEAIQFQPNFTDQLAFLYLGQKQDSREGIQQYRNIQEDKSEWITEIDIVTQKILLAEELDEFEYWISLHENLISRMLQIETVKDRLFTDYWGAIKSLGAWGGDFVLVTHSGDLDETKEYFKEKGFHVFIEYKNMIL